MKRRGGFFGSVVSLISLLVVIGLILAIFTQFNGDFGAIIRWFLDTSWGIITSVRDTVLGWDTFQRMF